MKEEIVKKDGRIGKTNELENNLTKWNVLRNLEGKIWKNCH